jgi:hypothetical protein
LNKIDFKGEIISRDESFHNVKKHQLAGEWRLTSINLATWEAEIRRNEVQSQSWQMVSETIS